MSRSFFVLLACFGALVTPRAASAALKIVATTSDLAALARAVAGDAAEVGALALHTQDPHFVDAKPSLALELNRADLLVVNGLDLEVGWLPVLQTGARNPKIQRGAPGFLDCSRVVNVLDAPQGKIDRSQGDIHPGGNPHYLRDPRAAAACARAIGDRLAQIAPDRAETFRRNTQAFLSSLEEARKRWEARLLWARGTPVVGYHKSWRYLVDWLGFEEVEYLEPKPGIPPSPVHVGRVLGIARQRGVKLVLQEDYYPDDTSRLVAQKVPAALVRLPGAPNVRGGETYIAWMERIVSALEQGLRGRGR